MIAGISTLGITLGYALETEAGKKPTSFTKINRINSIGGISQSTEQIDASAIEDKASRYVSGRQDSGGEWTVTVNFTNETQQEWETLIDAYKNRGENLRMWWQVISEDLTDAFFVVAQPPQVVPMPEIGQNELLTVEMTLSIDEYIGNDAKVAMA